MTLLLLFLSLFFIISGFFTLLYNKKYYYFRKTTKLPFFHKKKYENRELSKRKDIFKRAQALVTILLGITWICFSGIQIYKAPDKVITLIGNPLDEDLVSVVDRFVQKEHIPGLVVGIIEEDKNSLLCSGYSDLDEEIKVDEKTLFEIGSLTKVFTGAMLAKAIEDGKLTLDSSISDLLVSSEGYENLQPITLKHLATHTSGLPRMILSPKVFVPAVIKTLFLQNPYSSYSDEVVLGFLADYKVNDLSNATHSYSNVGVGLLGYIVSHSYDKTYGEAVQNVIFKPLGMNDSSLDEGNQSQGSANGYAGNYPLNPSKWAFCFKSKPWYFDDIMAGAGAIRSNGEDMLIFLDACMKGTHSFLNASMEPLYEENGFSSGMCWGRIERSNAGGNLVFHDGGTGGFRSFIVFNKETKMGVVILSNSTKKVSSLGLQLMNMLYEDTKKPDSK